MPLSRVEIERILVKDVERAARDHEVASAEFWRINEMMADGPPNAEVAERLVRALAVHKTATEALTLALERLSDLTLRDIVPQEMRDSA